MKTRFIFLAGVMLAACMAVATLADGVNANIAVNITKGNLSLLRAFNKTFTISAARPNVSGFTQLITTNAAQPLSLGSVVTPGWAWFSNVGSNGNTIAVGVLDEGNTNFLEFVRLLPGEYFPLRLGTNAPYARSIGTNEASTVFECPIIDN